MAAKQEAKFESMLEQLQEIVRNLESGEFSLEDSIKKFEEGMALAKNCQAKLNKAEQRIEVLVKAEKGNVTTEPFSADE